MSKPRHNPERRSWRGRSHKKGSTRVATLAAAQVALEPVQTEAEACRAIIHALSNQPEHPDRVACEKRLAELQK
jgi:hypothetical protein